MNFKTHCLAIIYTLLCTILSGMLYNIAVITYWGLSCHYLSHAHISHAHTHHPNKRHSNLNAHLILVFWEIWWVFLYVHMQNTCHSIAKKSCNVIMCCVISLSLPPSLCLSLSLRVCCFFCSSILLLGLYVFVNPFAFVIFQNIARTSFYHNQKLL